MGVVWRGGVHIVCSTEAQENEMAYYLSPQTYLSLPVNQRCDHHPAKNNEPTQGV